MNYDLIIVGSGFSGATVAYLAARKGRRVLLLEKRAHIAGNMYDYRDQSGILVQKYGPHSMHTDDQNVIDFLVNVWDWEPYTLRARSVIDGKTTPVPFNFKTIDDFYPQEEAQLLKEQLLSSYGNTEKVPVLELLSSPDEKIRAYAEFLFEKDYRPYTAKQWGVPPEALDPSILGRVPVRLSYADQYFDDKWQTLPKGSFTDLFKKLLESPNIDTRLNEDVLGHLTLCDNGEVLFDGEKLHIPLVYTGALDELFGKRLGALPYRSLRFEFETRNTDSFQETSGVAYPTADGYTRITEYTKQPPQDGHGKTVICFEYPVPYGSEEGKEAYYPILTEASLKLATEYRSLAEKYRQLYLCGRLADFRYYNMDQAIAHAMVLYDKLKAQEDSF